MAVVRFLRFTFGFLRLVFGYFAKLLMRARAGTGGNNNNKIEFEHIYIGVCVYPYHCVFAGGVTWTRKKLVKQNDFTVVCKEANRQLVVKAMVHVRRYVCASRIYCACVCVYREGGFSLFFYFPIAHSL